jgi:hypothetical protein
LNRSTEENIESSSLPLLPSSKDKTTLKNQSRLDASTDAEVSSYRLQMEILCPGADNYCISATGGGSSEVAKGRGTLGNETTYLKLMNVNQLLALMDRAKRIKIIFDSFVNGDIRSVSIPG